MAGEKPPAFQFYARDYLSSTAVAAMTPEERGGYVHLLCHAWLQDDPGVLPMDDALLARLSDLHGDWEHCRAGILRAFRQSTRDGVSVIVQNRMTEERIAQTRRAEKASRGARATNALRYTSVASESLGPRSTLALQSASASAVTPESKTESKSSVVHEIPSIFPASPAPRPVLSLPLRDGTEFPILPSMVARWDRAFPDVLVTTTLREMLAWLEANPTRRKTRRGALRFVTGWLLREQEKAARKDARHGNPQR